MYIHVQVYVYMRDCVSWLLTGLCSHRYTCKCVCGGYIRVVYLGIGNGAESLLLELFSGLLVVSQVQLGANQDDWCVGAVVTHLRVPLCSRETYMYMYVYTNAAGVTLIKVCTLLHACMLP